MMLQAIRAPIRLRLVSRLQLSKLFSSTGDASLRQGETRSMSRSNGLDPTSVASAVGPREGERLATSGTNDIFAPQRRQVHRPFEMLMLYSRSPVGRARVAFASSRTYRRFSKHTAFAFPTYLPKPSVATSFIK